MVDLRYAPASMRNAEPILGVLRHEFRRAARVLEIGSGTGQHAVHFAAAMPAIIWQTSDLAEHHDQIRAHIEQAELGNVLPPLTLDVRDAAIGADRFDAVFSSNTMHIMSYDAVTAMLPLVGAALKPGGRFCYYGPFRYGGKFSTPSNAAFHDSLRARDTDMGLRNLEDIDDLAAAGGMFRRRTYAMPANNLCIVWSKQEDRQ